jgi:predicted O-linked N-acetylglucosamine transferase (SPINDLY family)
MTFSAEKLIKQGNEFHKSGQLDKAETVYRHILEKLPEHPDALHFLGIIAQQCDNYASAILLIKKAIKMSPDYYKAHNSLGNVYRESQKIEKAILSFTLAIKLKPDYAEPHFNLGLIAVTQGKPTKAIEYFRTSARLNPHHIHSHMEIGELFFNQGDEFNAQIAFKTILHIDKTNVAARCKLAQLLEKLKKYDAAIREYKIALWYLPESIHILNGISRLNNKIGGFDEALIYLNKALEIDDNNLETLHNLGLLHQSVGEINIATEYFTRAFACDPGSDRAEKCLLSLALTNSEYTNIDIFNIHLKLRKRHDKPEFTNRVFVNRSTDPNKKIKIGYLSSDFKTHPVALNTLSLITGHRRDSFETYLYYHSTNNDEVTEVFIQNSDHFKFVETMSDKEIADLIEEDGIDILVTLAGRFDENRPLVSTYKPAPVQVSFHDCATSGLAAMDYYLTDSIIHPLTTKDKFTEELYRLPTYYQYPVIKSKSLINNTPALQNGYITFCSFSKPEKISDEVVKLWSDILHVVPNSRLLMKYFEYYSSPSLRTRTIQRFTKHNINKERLILDGSNKTRTDHLTLYHQADISLDPFPFNGATTTFEALSMGVPVITLQGNHFVSRVATSLVTHIGHPEFAVKSRQQYITLAKSLSSNLSNLNKIRQSLRDELESSSLCQGYNYITSVEAAFRSMWQKWCKNYSYKPD